MGDHLKWRFPKSILKDFHQACFSVSFESKEQMWVIVFKMVNQMDFPSSVDVSWLFARPVRWRRRLWFPNAIENKPNEFLRTLSWKSSVTTHLSDMSVTFVTSWRAELCVWQRWTSEWISWFLACCLLTDWLEENWSGAEGNIAPLVTFKSQEGNYCTKTNKSTWK